MWQYSYFSLFLYIAKTGSEFKKKKNTHTKPKTDFIISLCSETLLHEKKYVMDPLPSYIFNSEVMYLPYFTGMENRGREEMEGKERQEHVL